jgi:hypothetical protein
LPFQLWGVDRDDGPQHFEVHLEVAVHHTISGRDDLPPRDVRVPRSHLIGPVTSGLANDLDQVDESELEIFFLFERLIPAFPPRDDLLGGLEDVEQPLAIAPQTATASALTRFLMRGFTPASVATCVNTPSKFSTSRANLAISKIAMAGFNVH